MSKGLKNTIIFSFGAAIGAAAAWYCAKRYYSELANEEIESVKETYRRVSKRTEDAEQHDNDDAIINDASDEEDEDGSEESDMVNEDKPRDRPYVIEPDEYGEKGYDEVSLTYYADGVLADDYDNEIKDVDEVVGFENLEKIGEYEDDAVHVRNDKLRTDYEILVDYREYDDILRLNSRDKVEG